MDVKEKKKQQKYCAGFISVGTRFSLVIISS